MAQFFLKGEFPEIKGHFFVYSKIFGGVYIPPVPFPVPMALQQNSSSWFFLFENISHAPRKLVPYSEISTWYQNKVQ